MSKKSILLPQVFMTFIVAASMSGIMGLTIGVPSMEWLSSWPFQFLFAWPIAFALTMVAWPTSMKLAAAALKPRPAAPAQ